MDKHSSTMDEVNYHLCMHKLSGHTILCATFSYIVFVSCSVVKFKNR